jgi:hypothetical protein
MGIQSQSSQVRHVSYQVFGDEAHEDLHRCLRGGQTQESAYKGKRQAFGGELSHEADTRCAKRAAYGYLASAALRSDQ